MDSPFPQQISTPISWDSTFIEVAVFVPVCVERSHPTTNSHHVLRSFLGRKNNSTDHTFPLHQNLGSDFLGRFGVGKITKVLSFYLVIAYCIWDEANYQKCYFKADMRCSSLGWRLVSWRDLSNLVMKSYIWLQSRWICTNYVTNWIFTTWKSCH